MNVSAPAPSVTAKPADPPATADAQDHTTFLDVLSALNPLQYLPVVGTIYRAITGDRPPEGVRIAGSLLASGLMGGPVGLAIGAASAALQQATGISLDSAMDALTTPSSPSGALMQTVSRSSGGANGFEGDQIPATPPAIAIAAYQQTLGTNRYGPV
jgi:hypothetical protein